MPRPEVREITFTIDGREVLAPENMMLVDAAKLGDVEIPAFCYEPKLGAPVGACRMCLVEVEGIPKLQTACSTAVKDGMVVTTQSDRVKAAQNTVVEFLLLNHPLDCPVCDKGGECPLQDISFGWGNGVSRFVEAKRHFEKPVELSPLIAIDRERCILCYRCVRFSQELSEDYQLVFRDRGANTFVGTFDGTPYIAPFSGNITELCPVGALTSQSYRFRARPWDIEGSGSVCSLCPSQCNVTYTVRDDRVLRVLSRQNDEVDDGWLCDRGRYSFQSMYADERITTPLVRDGGVLRPATWERALDEAAAALRRAGPTTGLVGGGGTSGEVAYLAQRIVREHLGGSDIDSRAVARIDRNAQLALADPRLQATVPDLEFANTVLLLGVEPLDAMPALDLRLRKGVRRNRVKLAVATARPSALDASAQTVVRFAPGEEPRAAALLADALTGGPVPAQLRQLIDLLRDGGDEIVVVYGEQVLREQAGAAALLTIAAALGLQRSGGGLLEVPTGGNARGLREAGLLPFAGPGLAPIARSGRDTDAIAAAAAAKEIPTLWLLGLDPTRDLPRTDWDEALANSFVIAHSAFATAGIAAHANVVFPAEVGGEGDGVIVHPDGRLQRLRQAVARPQGVRPGWWILDELGERLGFDLAAFAAPIASAQLLAAVPLYCGLTLDRIGGKGIRWWQRDDRPTVPLPTTDDMQALLKAAPPQPGPDPIGSRLRVASFRTIWSSPEVEHAPVLAFTQTARHVELNPADAERLGVGDHDDVELRADSSGRASLDTSGEAITATALIRSDVPLGSAFVEGDDIGSPLVDIRPVGTPLLVGGPNRSQQR